MLVKFLSFIVSAFGTARYKAIVLSCFALILSLTGIAGMAIWHGSVRENAASKLERTAAQTDEQQRSPQVGGSKQTIQNQNTGNSTHDNTSQPSANTTPSANQTPKTTPGDTAPKQITVTLNKTAVTVPAGGQSEPITANATLPEGATWKLIADSDLGLDIITEEETATGLKFHIQTKSTIDPNRSYDVLLQIRDADQITILAAKTIAVTIQQ
jgi:type II secretory pathway pseudopilin PulG